MLTGSEPDPARARAVEQYLLSTMDHGFNASTFTARVVASTGADVAAFLVGAVGALSGPLHGGAPSRALDTLDAIGTSDRIAPWIHLRRGPRRRLERQHPGTGGGPEDHPSGGTVCGAGSAGAGPGGRLTRSSVVTREGPGIASMPGLDVVAQGVPGGTPAFRCPRSVPGAVPGSIPGSIPGGRDVKHPGCPSSRGAGSRA
jgi:hypothetical protein